MTVGAATGSAQAAALTATPEQTIAGGGGITGGPTSTGGGWINMDRDRDDRVFRGCPVDVIAFEPRVFRVFRG